MLTMVTKHVLNGMILGPRCEVSAVLLPALLDGLDRDAALEKWGSRPVFTKLNIFLKQIVRNNLKRRIGFHLEKKVFFGETFFCFKSL